jgi:hypothetical protein
LSGDDVPSFYRVGVPLLFSINKGNSCTEMDIMNDFQHIWNAEKEKFVSISFRKRKRDRSVFPFPRQPFQLDEMENDFTRQAMVPISGSGASYLCQIVECDLISDTKNPDFYPTILLCEILGRAEGPLYTKIRGQGSFII